MVVTSADIAGWINAYLWPFFRFAALFRFFEERPSMMTWYEP